MKNKTELIEGAIYLLKKDHFALKFNIKTNELCSNQLIKAGSHVFLDQFHDNYAIFACFNPYKNFYCRILKDKVEEMVELIDKNSLIPEIKTVDKT